jgi:hypothetical protein
MFQIGGKIVGGYLARTSCIYVTRKECHVQCHIIESGLKVSSFKTFILTRMFRFKPTSQFEERSHSVMSYALIEEDLISNCFY